jgi:hypothetical protein
VALAPGGERLCGYRYLPPAVTLFEVAGGAEDPRVFWLPGGTRVGLGGPWGPVWEDPDHLVAVVEHPGRGLDAPAVRLDVATGGLQRVPLTEQAGDRPLLVEPLLRPPQPRSGRSLTER